MSDFGDVIHEVKPSDWRFGVIYVNPDDERVVVPQRSGLGWTLNFGQPRLWLLLLGFPLALRLLRRVR